MNIGLVYLLSIIVIIANKRYLIQKIK